MAINPKQLKPQRKKTLLEKKLITSLRMQTILLIAITLVGVYVCYLIILPFLSILVWTLVLAVIFQPFYHWVEMRLHQTNLSAFIAVLVAGLMVVLPIMFVLQKIVIQTFHGAQLLEMQLNKQSLTQSPIFPYELSTIIAKVKQYFDVSNALKTFSDWLIKSAGMLVGGSVFQLIYFCLVFYILFFFIRDKQKILNTLNCLLPLSDFELKEMYDRIGDTVHAIVFGGFVIAFIQGTLGGLMFWWLGLPAPFVWGLLMTLLSVVPMFGSFIVWLPAAAYLLLLGHWIQALILIMWGMLVVGTIDNFLRPLLLSNRLQLHTLSIFLSILGGVLLFGSVGVILGPITIIITMIFLRAVNDRITF